MVRKVPIIPDHASKMKKRIEAAAEAAVVLNKKTERMEAAVTKALEECKGLKNENDILKEELAKLWAEKESEMERLRRSWEKEVQLERRRVRSTMVAKYADQLVKIRGHIKYEEKLNEVSLSISQITGTINCLKVLQTKGIVVPDETFKGLETDLAGYNAEYQVVPIDESFVDADLYLDPADEMSTPPPVSTRNANSEEPPDLDQFGSNVARVTPAAAASLQSPPAV